MSASGGQEGIWERDSTSGEDVIFQVWNLDAE